MEAENLKFVVVTKNRILKLILNYRTIALLALLAVSIFVSGDKDPRVSQLLIVPLVAYCLISFRFGDSTPSRRTVLLGVILSVAAFITEEYLPLPTSSPRIIVGRLQDDYLGSRSSLLREGMQRELSKVSGIKAYRSSNTSAESGFGLALEGRERWLSIKVTLPSHPVYAPWVPSLVTKLELQNDYPLTGFSYGTDRGAGERYLAYLGAGLEVGNDDLLSLSAAQAGGWTSTSHRALPLLVRATDTLIRAMSAPRYEERVVECAMDDLLRALPFLHSRDNRELFLTIHNNLAVARLLKAKIAGSKGRARKAHRDLREALGEGREGVSPSLVSLVEKNLELTVSPK